MPGFLTAATNIVKILEMLSHSCHSRNCIFVCLGNLILPVSTGSLYEYIRLIMFKSPKWVLAPRDTHLRVKFWILYKAGEAEGLLHPLFWATITCLLSAPLPISACPLHPLPRIVGRCCGWQKRPQLDLQASFFTTLYTESNATTDLWPEGKKKETTSRNVTTKLKSNNVKLWVEENAPVILLT